MAKKASRTTRAAAKRDNLAPESPITKNAAQGRTQPLVSFQHGEVVEVQVSASEYARAMAILCGPVDLTGVVAVSVAVPGAAGVATTRLRCVQPVQATEIAKSIRGDKSEK